MEQRKSTSEKFYDHMTLLKILVLVGLAAMLIATFLPFAKYSLADGLMDMLGMQEKNVIQAAEVMTFPQQSEGFINVDYGYGYDIDMGDIDMGDLDDAMGDLENAVDEALNPEISFLSDLSWVDELLGTSYNSIKMVILVFIIVFIVAAGVLICFGFGKLALTSTILAEVTESFVVILFIASSGFSIAYGYYIFACGYCLAFWCTIMIILANRWYRLNGQHATGSTSMSQAAGISYANNNVNRSNMNNNVSAFVANGGGGSEDMATVLINEDNTVGHNNNMNNQSAIVNGIQILDGTMQGIKIPLDDNVPLNIGKDPQCAAIVIDKQFTSVSRLHCSVMYSRQYNKYFVTDSSSNGTYLDDGTRLQKGVRTPVDKMRVLKLADDKCRIRLL